jgi:hypothetical protein
MDQDFHHMDAARRSTHRSTRSDSSSADTLVPEACVPFSPMRRAHMLRVVEGVVIDSPVPTRQPDAQEWAATCRLDAAAPDGWSRTLWWESPTHRGWLPVDLDHFDVVEFAADVPLRRRWRRMRWLPVRWCGVALGEVPLGVVVYGPYPTLDAARADTERLRFTLGF